MTRFTTRRVQELSMTMIKFNLSELEDREDVRGSAHVTGISRFQKRLPIVSNSACRHPLPHVLSWDSLTRRSSVCCLFDHKLPVSSVGFDSTLARGHGCLTQALSTHLNPQARFTVFLLPLPGKHCDIHGNEWMENSKADLCYVILREWVYNDRLNGTQSYLV